MAYVHQCLDIDERGTFLANTVLYRTKAQIYHLCGGKLQGGFFFPLTYIIRP